MLYCRIKTICKAIGQPATIRQKGSGKSGTFHRCIYFVVFITVVETLFIVFTKLIAIMQTATPVLGYAVFAAAKILIVAVRHGHIHTSAIFCYTHIHTGASTIVLRILPVKVGLPCIAHYAISSQLSFIFKSIYHRAVTILIL